MIGRKSIEQKNIGGIFLIKKSDKQKMKKKQRKLWSKKQFSKKVDLKKEWFSVYNFFNQVFY